MGTERACGAIIGTESSLRDDHGSIADYASAPIINQPNSAILSLNIITRRPVAVGDTIAIHPVTILGFCYDHRAFDGVTASRFMAHVRDSLQDRNWDTEVG